VKQFQAKSSSYFDLQQISNQLESMSRKNNIGFTKRPEPKFIREMKERLRYKEADTVDTKVCFALPI
jgi:hypothetical protein